MVTKQKGMHTFLKIYPLGKQSYSKGTSIHQACKHYRSECDWLPWREEYKWISLRFLSNCVFSLPHTGMASLPFTKAIQVWGRSCLSIGRSTGEEFDWQDPWETTFPESRCICLSKVKPKDILRKFLKWQEHVLNDEWPKEIGNSQNKAEEDLLINRGSRYC